MGWLGGFIGLWLGSGMVLRFYGGMGWAVIRWDGLGSYKVVCIIIP